MRLNFEETLLRLSPLRTGLSVQSGSAELLGCCYGLCWSDFEYRWIHGEVLDRLVEAATDLIFLVWISRVA